MPARCGPELACQGDDAVSHPYGDACRVGEQDLGEHLVLPGCCAS
jgi:hypothetical protein